MTPELVADLLINGIALAACLCAVPALAGPDSAVGRRLRRLLIAIALLLALRLLNWTVPSLLLAIPVTVIAAWLPLLALRAAEQLVRRHAPLALKHVALWGAAGLSIAALLTGAFFPAALMIVLAAFQAAMLLWIAAFLARARDLSPAEARQAATFALALLLAIPFAISDFRGSLPGLPVRMGGIGVLLFVLTTARLYAGTGSPRLLLSDLLGLIACGALLAGGGALLLPAAQPADLWRLGALAAAVVALMLIVARLRDLGRADRQRLSVLAALPALPDDPGADALLAASPLTAAGTFVDLTLYDPPAVTALAEHRVVTAATPLPPGAGSVAANLFAEHAATHLVRLAAHPPRFLAVNGGQLGAGGPLDVELDILARLAARSAA